MLKRQLLVLLAVLLAGASLVAQPTLAAPGNGSGQNPHATPTPTQTQTVPPMGVSQIVGSEMGAAATGGQHAWLPEAFGGDSSGISAKTAAARSGTYGIQASPSNAVARAVFAQREAGGATPSVYLSARVYFNISGSNTLTETFNGMLATGTTTPGYAAGSVRVEYSQASGVPSMRIGIFNGTTWTTSADTTVSAATIGQWHLLEMDAGYNAGADARFYVDGVLIASVSGSVSAQPAGLVGILDGTSLAVHFFDDLVWYDSALNGPLGSDYSIGLLLPASDNTISPAGAWTEGAGGTGSLFAAVKTVPPGGLATETNTSQDKSASGTNPAFYVANMQTYSAGLALTAFDTVLAVQAIVNHAENIATGTKNGDVWVSGNPAQSQPTSTGVGSFNYGDDSGAVTNFTTNPSTWRTAVGPVTANPSVTVTTAPTVRVDKIDATTREANIDFLGLYVMYQRGLSAELFGRPYGLRGAQQMNQLLAQ